MALVVAETKGKPCATATAFFAELAHHPASLWISLPQQSRVHELVLQSGEFTLIMLGVGQREIALTCGRGASDALHFSRAEDGSWQLSGALTSIACRVRSTVEVGDHTLFLAEILSAWIDTDRMHVCQLLSSDL